MSAHTSSISHQPANGYQPSLVSDKFIKKISPANQHPRMVPAERITEIPSPFISALVHEVRNPLTNINLALELLDSSRTDSDQQLYLDIIRRSSARINVLIGDLLKHQAPVKVRPEKISLYQLLDEVLEVAGDRILLKKVSVCKEYANNDLKIALDRRNMFIALINIVVNAIEAMTDGEGVLKMITQSAAGRYILEIEDNGCGISQENMKHIFEPYFTRKAAGMGVGLATTYETLRANHVGVRVESEEGKGTRFILSFGGGRI